MEAVEVVGLLLLRCSLESPAVAVAVVALGTAVGQVAVVDQVAAPDSEYPGPVAHPDSGDPLAWK